jgi:hypothetical protein
MARSRTPIYPLAKRLVKEGGGLDQVGVPGCRTSTFGLPVARSAVGLTAKWLQEGSGFDTI